MQDSSKKNTNKNNTEKLDDTAYYNELYNDFPEDIKDILMETHPLRGKDLGSETAAYRTRKREISEVEAVKQARSKKIKEEINNMETNKLSESKNSNNVDISKNINENKNKTNTKNNKIKNDDEYEVIQTVKIKPSSKAIIQDRPIQAPKKKRKNSNYTIPQKKSKKEQHNAYDEDFERFVKDASIEDLYGKEDYDEDDKINLPEGKKLIIAGGAVFIILFLFFAFKTITLSSQLQKANTELQTMVETQEENEKLKMEILSLQEELYKYTGSKEPAKEDTNSASTGNFDTYTVVAGDTIGSIATKVYGDFGSYTKILEANGLTENSNIQIGQVLKIPR